MSALADLIGRGVELERLHSLLAPDGPPAIVLEGAAGVGKSRLLTELCETVGEQWHLELVLGASALHPIPYGAVSYLLPAQSSVDPTGMLAALRRVLLRRADGLPLVLAVDDAHLLDDATAALIGQLVGRGEARIALTLLTGRVPPAPILSLWEDGRTVFVDVAPLSEPDTAAAAESILGGRIDPALRLAVWDLSRGHPLYAVVALRSALADGTLARHGDQWQLRGNLAAGHLTTLIRARARQLDPDAYAALEFAALALPLQRKQFAVLVDESVIDRLIEEGFLTSTEQAGTPHLRPAHPLIARVVRQALSAERRRHLSEQLMEAVGTGALRHDPDAQLRVAVWMLDTDRPVDGPLLVGASREALRRGDLPLAERIARAAIDEPDVGVPAGVLLARCLAFTGRPDDALRVLADARPATADERLDVAMTRGHITAFLLGQPRAAAQLLEEVAASLPVELRWQLDTERSIYGAFAGDFAKTFEAANAAIANPRISGPSLATAHVNLALAHSMTGDVVGMLGAVEQGARLADDHHEALPLARDQIELSHASGLLAAGRLDDADRLCEERLDDDISGAGPIRPSWLAWHAIITGFRGHLANAVNLIEQSILLYETADPFRLHAQSLGLSVLFRAQIGPRSASDEATLRQARQEAGDETRLTIWVDRGAASTLAWSDPRSAAIEAHKHGIRAIERDHRVWGAWALHDAVRWGHPGIVVDELAAVAGHMRGADLVVAMSDHAAALAEHDVDRLERTAMRMLDFGSTLFACEILVQLAGLLRETHPIFARRASVKAQILLEHCPGAMTPCTRTLEPALTPREFEIALDSLGGRSSRQMAEARFLSVRTVDNHLRSIYRKLDVASRDDLRDLLRPVAASSDDPDEFGQNGRWSE